MLLEEELGDETINHSICDIVIPSFDMVSHKGFHFEYFKDDVSSHKTFKDVDVILATTAAPTYFPSVQVKDTVNPKVVYNMIDGGIIANNPAEFAYRECMKHANIDDKEVCILSIGTGSAPEDVVYYQESKDWGLIEYLNPLIDSLFDASSLFVNENMKALAEENKIRFYRANIDIPQEAANMDDISDDNIERLHELGKKCFQKCFVEDSKGREFLKLLQDRVKELKK